MKSRTLIAVAIFVVALLLSWIFHGRGVVKNDTARNIYIPQTLTIPLHVKAAYNGDKIFFRYRGHLDKRKMHFAVPRTTATRSSSVTAGPPSNRISTTT